MNESELIDKVRSENCNESLVKLIDKHSPLCYNIYKKYSSPLLASGVDYNRISSEKDYIIYKSCLSYSPEKNTKFSTWLGNYARYHYLNMINEDKRHVYVDDETLSFHMEEQNYSSENFNVIEFREYVLNILSQLKDERIKSIFELRYFSGEAKPTWNKISRKMNISIQTAINLHSRGVKILRQKIDCKNFEDLV